MRKKIIIAALLLSASGFAQASYEVECEGYNDDTSAYVSGTCTDGDFSGYDSETGEYVYGDCEFDGDLNGYDSDTGEHVSGSCEGE
ncbi:hypothetical protein [Pseudomonas sp. OTU750018]|uniref:hypothetical protein n=1 Tax=Pseudomonas sp. OTU750018 TaxID=2709708 RepID=UPI0014227CDD|nr:hypothetical protein [Pseudomonas sp. OTU750018]